MTLPATGRVIQDESACCLTFKIVECRKRQVYFKEAWCLDIEPIRISPEWQEPYLSTSLLYFEKQSLGIMNRIKGKISGT
jgi:hypothetical protein